MIVKKVQRTFLTNMDAAQRAHSRRKALAHFWAEKCFSEAHVPGKNGFD